MLAETFGVGHNVLCHRHEIRRAEECRYLEPMLERKLPDTALLAGQHRALVLVELHRIDTGGDCDLHGTRNQSRASNASERDAARMSETRADRRR